ncbi:MAG TPA: cell division protein FtsQ/DivIB [Elusimicrobiota bacterium]|nr:cell division protein FtsQ/DivIB [Elusimicrobiota bacterium]
MDEFSVEGGPEPLRVAVLAASGWKPGQRWGPGRASELERGLLERFRCLASANVSRSWTRRSATLRIGLRAAAARATRPGWTGFLGEDGVLFDVPEGVVDGEGLPAVDLGSYAGEGAPELARLLRASREGKLSGEIRALRYEGEDGWTAETSEGLVLRWGDLRWTEQKLSRLGEVLKDAGTRFGGAQSADLRHFDEGKIFVRPR